MEIPNYIVHYNRGEPFRSISGVPSENLLNVLSQLNESNAWGLGRFSDPEYLQRRLVVEQRMREEFIKKGGKPVLKHPIYFFLGRNQQFEEHGKNKGYLVQLKSLPQDTVSFTYGDSMFSLNEDYRQLKGQGYLSKLCTQVYTFKDLPKIFDHPDFQAQNRLHIEAQLWVTPTVTEVK